MQPSSRQELAVMLEWAMTRPRDRGPNRRRRPTAVKTYIIESTAQEEGESGDAYQIIGRTVATLAVFGKQGPVLHQAQEKTLVTIEGVVDKEKVELHVDFTNPRFWLVHSISEMEALERVTKAWVESATELDRAWIPVSLMSSFRRLGHLTGVSLLFEDFKTIPAPDSTSDIIGESFKMRFNGTKAERVLSTVQKEGAGCEHQAALSSIRLREDRDGTKLSSEIRYDGRIYGRGNSFDQHNFLVTSVLREYRQQIRSLEKRHTIRAIETQQGMTIAGRPLCIKLPVAISDVRAFCERVFSCSLPFRLFGLPLSIGPDYFYVQAIDMHTTGLLRFEISPTLIRIYLLNGTCGNAILRFVTNLQHSFDARIDDQILLPGEEQT